LWYFHRAKLGPHRAKWATLFLQLEVFHHEILCCIRV
jgi:hypothetical protein